MAVLRAYWSAVAHNGWNNVEQGWNRVWAIRMDHYDPFTALLNLKFGPQEVPNWVKMAQKCSFEVQLDCSDPKWLEQGGTRLEQGMGH